MVSLAGKFCKQRGFELLQNSLLVLFWVPCFFYGVYLGAQMILGSIYSLFLSWLDIGEVYNGLIHFIQKLLPQTLAQHLPGIAMGLAPYICFGSGALILANLCHILLTKGILACLNPKKWWSMSVLAFPMMLFCLGPLHGWSWGLAFLGMMAVKSVGLPLMSVCFRDLYKLIKPSKTTPSFLRRLNNLFGKLRKGFSAQTFQVYLPFGIWIGASALGFPFTVGFWSAVGLSASVGLFFTWHEQWEKFARKLHMENAKNQPPRRQMAPDDIQRVQKLKKQNPKKVRTLTPSYDLDHSNDAPERPNDRTRSLKPILGRRKKVAS